MRHEPKQLSLDDTPQRCWLAAKYRDSEQIEFRDAILMKTSRDPTIESGSPIRVYRFEENLGFRENKRR